MNDTSRRKVLGVAAAGVVGTAGVVALGSGAASASTGAAKEPLVAHVEDPASDVLHLMLGEREVVVRDRDLVIRLLNAAGGN